MTRERLFDLAVWTWIAVALGFLLFAVCTDADDTVTVESTSPDNPVAGLDEAVELAADLPTTTSSARVSSTTARASRKAAPAHRRPVVSGAATSQPTTNENQIGSWSTAGASWYGPGFYGRRTACGQLYSPSILGVAHKSLPCGTLVEFEHNGITIVAPVIDRGPFTPGRMWDLSHELCARLGRCYTAPIRWRLAS